MEHFLSAYMTQLISLPSFRTCNLTSALHEHQFEKLSFERESFRCRCQLRKAVSGEIEIRTLRAFPARRTSHVCAARFPNGPNCTKDCRDFDCRSLTASYELRLIKVCDEVSMCLCFWLTALSQDVQNSCHPFLLIQPVAGATWLAPQWTVRAA